MTQHNTQQKTQLEALKAFSTVVADTGDFNQLVAFHPQDATTNPTLILRAVQKKEYAYLLEEVVEKYRLLPLDEIVDRLLVRFGCEILRLVPGRVSTEVDARLSFDEEATYQRGKRLIAIYKTEGIDAERVLIKVAATWEGIQAAKRLELDGIHTNITLLFSFCQAVACSTAKVQLISPFVGRIYDWAKKNAGAAWVESEHQLNKDPGVQSVQHIFNYYKKFDIKTEIMGASFRNTGQIIALAGCDLLTISPDLLAQLSGNFTPVVRILDADEAKKMCLEKAVFNESEFRFAMNEDVMANDKLAEGIRAFVSDAQKLDQLLVSVKSA
jgi:transaldolase